MYMCVYIYIEREIYVYNTFHIYKHTVIVIGLFGPESRAAEQAGRRRTHRRSLQL